MISRAIAMTVRIIAFLFNNSNEKDVRKRLPKEDYLTHEDWHILSETSTILKPFYDQTMRLQSRAKNASHGALWEALISIELLLNHIIDAKIRYDVDPDIIDTTSEDAATVQARKHIKTSLNNCCGGAELLPSKRRQLIDRPLYL